MENLSCKMIEDILPLYVDGVCSEESRAAVEEHLAQCESCREKLEQMKAGLPKAEVKRNLDDSAMMEKLSSAWQKNTKLSVKTSIICVIFYVVAYLLLVVIKLLGDKARTTFYYGYQIASYFVNCALWLILGGLIFYIASQQNPSVKTRILELLIIAVPCAFMVLFPFIGSFLPLGVWNFLLSNLITIPFIGSLLLGCEIFRLVKHLAQRKK